MVDVVMLAEDLESDGSKAVDWIEDTHVLIHFDDENSSSIVPIKRLERKENLRVGDDCYVIWSDKRKYPGVLILSGSMESCAAKQEELDKDSDVSDYHLADDSDLSKSDGEIIELSDEEKQKKHNNQKKPKKYRTKEQCESDNENVPTSEDDDTRRREEKLIKIAPVHYTGGVKDCSERFSELGKRLEDIKAEVSSIWEKQDVRMVNIEKYLLEISKNTRTVAATNVAKILGPSISSSISDNISTPDTSFDNALNEIENEDLLKSTVDDHTESPEPIPQLGDKRPQMGEQKEAKNKNSFPYSKDLIPAGQLPYIYTKSKTRRNFAALLVKRLFDVETLLKSNVSGRGKEQLDPEIIKYVKAKAFEYYECPQPEVKKEWAKCVIAIDEKSRSLKKRKSYKENQSLDVINDKLQGLSKLKVLEEKNSTDDIEERIRALQELKKQKEKQ